MIKLWPVFFLTLLGSIAAHAGTPDCAKAVTRLDKAICASPELTAANDKLAAALKDALAKAPPEFAESLRADHSAWLRNLDVDCNVRKGYSDCLLGYFNNRIQSLAELVEPLGGRTFVWRSIALGVKDKPAPIPEDCDVDNTWGFSTLDAGWPQLAGDTPETRAFNLALETATRNFNHPEIKGPINTWAQALGAPDQSVFSVGVQIQFVGKNMIAATIESRHTDHCDTYDTPSNRAFNWLLAEQRELTANDIFLPASDWKKALEKAVRESVASANQGGLDGVDFAAELKVLLQIYDNPHNWQLDPDGLTIVFTEGKVLSHGDIPSINTIPWDDLKPILQPTFEIPVEGSSSLGVDKSAAGL